VAAVAEEAGVLPNADDGAAAACDVYNDGACGVFPVKVRLPQLLPYQV